MHQESVVSFPCTHDFTKICRKIFVHIKKILDANSNAAATEYVWSEITIDWI